MYLWVCGIRENNRTMSAIRTCPAVIISAPASGQGKTTITCGIARLFTRKGLRVKVFKCGPDFIDPYWLELASGNPVYQIDMWMTGEEDCRRRLFEAAKDADLILIEGAMGLYDGAPSAADLAIKFNIPVLAVIDASSMAGTFGALVHGLKTYQKELPWGGVLANRVATEGHAQMLREAINDPADWFGAVYRNMKMVMPERHLGLVIAKEVEDYIQRLDCFADALENTELANMSNADLNKWNVNFEEPAKCLKPENLLSGKTIAIAKDEAFCFIYPANIDVLNELGAKVVYFSPLHDKSIPGCDALWFPGGYPELYLDHIQNNHQMRESVKQQILKNTPIWAECGGMMVLFQEIISVDGVRHPGWGILEGAIQMQNKLGGLGAQSLDIDTGVLRGHTFHYSVCNTHIPVKKYAVKKVKTSTAGEALYEVGSIAASYFHAWFPSSLEATASLFLPRTSSN